MKNVGRILILAIVMFVGAYWAAANPGSAKKAKNTADSIASEVKSNVEKAKQNMLDD